ncbi:hypothetical protein KC901_00180 [Patescibacteria group bacterium]|nr:hypothetical protein [Patescibacteria group bacterium]
MGFFGTIGDFFQSDFSGLLTFFYILSGIITAAFLGGCIYSWLGILSVSEREKDRKEKHFKIIRENKSPRAQQWDSIVNMFRSDDPVQWRMAIIDADTVLEELITELGYQGDTFGEKLMSLKHDGISWTDAAWEVHLLRNKLAHEGSRYPLNQREAFRAYKIYENILMGNGYLA